MAVLDLGGTPDYWRRAPTRPRDVTLVNMDPELEAGEAWMRLVVADACDPAVSGHFDLVVSNSLVEHIPKSRRARFADVVRAAADQHWIQTPYRYFPIEPHWLFPGFQFLPFAGRVAVTRLWPFGHRHTHDAARARDFVAEVELLDIRELRGYFPSSEIWHEKFAGLTKSVVAVRGSI